MQYQATLISNDCVKLKYFIASN